MSYPHPMDDHTGFADPNELFCEYCGASISPNDKHAICADPSGGDCQIICEHCQERAYDRHQENLMEGGGGPSLIEQQREAWRLK